MGTTTEVKYVLTLQDLLTSKLSAADKEANKLESTLGSVNGILATIGAAAGIGMFIQSMVEAGSKVEDARVGLTTLLGDAEQAGKVIERTMEDATKTPFAFEGLLSANKALIAADESAEAARETVLNLANAIAATGGGDDELNRMVVNLQQIKNTGKATALDIKQFAYAGINVYKLLAEATGEPIDKVKDMEVSYDMLTMALKKAHDEGGIYANGLENMAGNTSVQISNLGDAMFQLKVKMFDDLKPAISVVLEVMGNMVDNLRNGWDWLVKNREIVNGVAAALGTLALGVVAYNGYLLVLAINSGLATAATFIQMVATEGLAASLYAAGVTGATAWALMTGGLSLIIAGLVIAWQKSEEFRGAVYGLYEVVKVVGAKIGNFFIGLGKALLGAFLLKPEMIKDGWTQMSGALEGVGEDAANAWNKGYAKGNANYGVSPSTDGTGKPFSMLLDKDETQKDATKKKAKTDISPTKASGTKSVTVNIQIGSLIEKFTINTTNVQESSSKIREKIANALVSSVNDAAITANI